uniref:Cytochrome c oxidase assembly protein COX16 homolog, mitochondrial n=1 Tax=Panagrolaimus sp. JU765 TaxID=591449 RepID=A0AC34QPP0_9BILA
MSNSNLKFIKVGLPFLTIVFGSAFGLHYFQQVRYDFARVKKEAANIDKIHQSLSDLGVKTKKNVTVEEVYQEVSELETDNWDNIRGPREFEDNSEYETAKKRQQEEARARRKALREKLKQGDEQ